MRIAIVINSSWNVYNFRKNLIKALLERGDEVIAIAPKDEYSKKLVAMGCEFYPVPMNTTGVNPIRDLLLLFRLIRIYKKVKADVFLHYTIKPGIYGTLAAKFAGSAAVINNVSGLGTVFIQDNWVLSVAVQLYKHSFKFADHIFFQNPDDKKLFLSLVNPEGPSTSVIPGSGIDHHRFFPKFNTNGHFTFLMVARILVEKGVKEYVEAARILKGKGLNVKFLLLGQIEKKHLRAISAATVQQWHDEKVIEYVGVTDKVEDWIARAHVVVLPSYREGLPKTLLEGAAMSRPLIASDVPGCNAVVHDGVTGLLCKERDVDSLADAMQRMMFFTDDERSAMGENARQHVITHFDDSFVVDEYLEKINYYTSSETPKTHQLKEVFG
ncbi:MAG: glycosyltransferase family 4 protein [Imperialibacter sp.]|uniref:glycosyltransferase family 4 protein n=1 Tax=Imperialibacter sp. TaxID=2038411 RepID=UPI0032ECC0C5